MSSPYDPQQPYPPPPAAQPPQRKRHWLRNTVLAVGGVIVLIIVLAVAGSHSSSSSSSVRRQPVTQASATVSPAANTLNASEQDFVANVRFALAKGGFSNTSSDAQIAAVGTDICKARQDGGSEADVIAATTGTMASMNMTPRQVVRTAERDICPAEVQAAQTVTYIVTGTPGADVTYGPAGSNFQGTSPMRVVRPLGSPEFYAIDAQLQGGGQVACAIKVDGKTISRSVASGGYNIASCEISQNLLTGEWENTNG